MVYFQKQILERMALESIEVIVNDLKNDLKRKYTPTRVFTVSANAKNINFAKNYMSLSNMLFQILLNLAPCSNRDFLK